MDIFKDNSKSMLLLRTCYCYTHPYYTVKIQAKCRTLEVKAGPRSPRPTSPDRDESTSCVYRVFLPQWEPCRLILVQATKATANIG